MVQGWTREKRLAFEEAFYGFLDQCYVNSKDHGPICLGKHLYDGQRRFLTAVFDGLEAGKHKFFVLKSRQLGLTTISRALSIFYLGVHRGLKGCLVFDTAPNKEEARAELETMIADLPPRIRFPKIRRSNRDELTLLNDSKMLFKSAGVKKSKSSGTLGRSVGLSMAHLSELCSYDNDEGLESFEQSLSDSHPDRLYIYESTARGYNRWWELWQEAVNDPRHCVTIFLGWWSKDSQKIARNDPDFELYGVMPPTDKELKKIAQVREQYGHQVTDEQLAWIRRKMAPGAVAQGDASAEFEGSPERIQEQAWSAEEAFQQTGSQFFESTQLTDLTNRYASNKFQAFSYIPGIEFVDMRVRKAPNTRMIELKVWDEPDPLGTYVVAIDPAFGEREDNDRSSIQVLRCYADGCDQVAEYAWPLINTRQFAWVIASILGWYGAEQAEVRYILELNGPGTAVFNELRSLRHQIESGYQPEIAERGLRDVFRNVKTFIYTRPDSLGVGMNYHFKTNVQNKITLMNRLRDFVSNGMLHVRSVAALGEMRNVTQTGDSIRAPGTLKDDRVVALALGVYYWDTVVRKTLIGQRRTRDAEAARKRASISDQVYLFQQNQLQYFFDRKHRERVTQRRQEVRLAWRYR